MDWFLAKYALYPNIVILVGYGTQGGTTFLLPEIIFLPYCVGYINVYWTSIGILPQECSLHRHAQKVFDNNNSIQEIVSRGIDLEHGNADVTEDF